MKHLLYILGLMLLVSCCGTSKTQENNQETVNPDGKYKITSVEAAKTIPEGAVLHFSDQKKLSGMSGCNNFSTTYTIEAKTISFSPLTATKRYCEGRMETEKAIFRAISNTKRIVSASKGEIIFISEEGNLLLKAKKQG